MLQGKPAGINPAARWFLRAVVAGLLLAVLACGTKNGNGPNDQEAVEPPPAPLFENITATSGITLTYRNGEDTAPHYSILESLGGGVALIDYDGDGRLDVFLPGGGFFSGKDKKDIVGAPSKLYRNLGGGKFKDVTAEVGLEKLAGGQPWFYSHAAAVADYDRDGWSDLLVTGWRRVALLRNVPADAKDPKKGRRFEDVTAKAGLDKGVLWGTSAGWADLDGDGYPDFYLCEYADWSWQKNPVCNYDGKNRDVCPPRQFHGLPHKVYRNRGDGTFQDVSTAAELLPGGPEASKGLGVVIVDIDGDGKPDVYVANDTTDNFLYMNVSKPGQIRFKEQGLHSGVARDDRGTPNGSMGVDAGDYDRSGRPSLWVTNYENELHALYGNECQRGLVFFNYQTAVAGIAAIGQKFVGWGTAFVDVNLDGWEDLFVANGHAIRFPTGKGVTRRQKPVLLLNRSGKFSDASARLGSYGASTYLSRGVAFGDLDNDGRIDMVINHTNQPVSVLRGIGGAGHHWLGVQLVGKGNACTVGARVVLEVDRQKQTRFAKGGGSYASSSDRRLHFGLGTATKVGRLTVVWPDGSQQHEGGLAVDRYHRIVQGSPK